MSTYRRKSPQQLRKSPSRSKSPQQLRKSPSRRKSPQQLRKSPQQFGNRVGANIWQGMGRKYAQEPEDVLSRSIGKTTISTEVLLIVSFNSFVVVIFVFSFFFTESYMYRSNIFSHKITLAFAVTYDCSNGLFSSYFRRTPVPEFQNLCLHNQFLPDLNIENALERYVKYRPLLASIALLAVVFLVLL